MQLSICNRVATQAAIAVLTDTLITLMNQNEALLTVILVVGIQTICQFESEPGRYNTQLVQLLIYK